ncbi:MAG: thioredoxin family protein [Carbonactinosporaceae bacterium]
MGHTGSVLTGVLTGAAVLLAATAFGLAWRRRNGRLRAPATGERLTVGDLGVPLGERVTLVQFSTAFCQPCRATRRILADVAAMTDGVVHAEVDAESHLPLVRRLGVLRTPTVFVLDRDGRIVRRASGQPRKADVIAALGDAV